MSYYSHFPQSDSYRPESSWVPVTVGLLWGAFLGLLLRFLFGLLFAGALTLLGADAAQASSPQWKESLFSAEGKVADFDLGKRSFQFEVGRTVKGAPLSARILQRTPQGTETLSYCRLAHRIDRNDGNWEALQFQCESTRFPALVSPVSLLRSMTKNEPLVVRFGTWSGGYRDAPLVVMRDQFLPKLAP